MNSNQQSATGQFIANTPLLSGRRILLCISLVSVLLIIVALFLGPYSINASSAIFWQLRLPHVLAVCLVGIALGVAGCLIQTFLQNPLADPALLGLSSGASLAVVGAMSLVSVFNLSVAPIWLSVAAFMGAAAVTAFLLLVLRLTKRFGVAGIILVGVALNAILGAAISLILIFSNQLLISKALMWSLGHISYENYPVLFCSFVLLALGLLITVFLIPSLDKMMLGEKNAFLMGVNLSRYRCLVLLAVSLLVGSAVILSGPIAFVGLLVPHLARICVGLRHRMQLFTSGLLGLVWMLLANMLHGLFEPYDLPIGVLCALIGGPLFILLLMKMAVRSKC